MTDTLDRLKAALAGRYAIERELGAGGMATVYLAHALPSAEALARRRRMNALATRLERRNRVSFRTRRAAPSRRFNAGKYAR